jgi:phosphatidylinositol alpha-mannosyltransferase
MNAQKSTHLKIGFVFDDSLDSVDGVSQQVKILGAWLGGQGHSVRYLVGETKMTEWAGSIVYSLAKNLPVSFNGNRVSIPLPASTKRIKAVLAVEDFDILHVQVPYSPFMAQKVIRHAPPSTAVVGTFHVLPSGPLSSVGSRLLRIWYGRSLDRFNRILSVSRPAADFAREAYGIDSKVLPNVIDVKKFKIQSRGVLPITGRIVYLNRLVKRKGCEQLLRAFKLVKQTQPTTKLVIAGRGPLRSHLEKLAGKLDITDDVEFLGFVAEDDKAALLATAEIACFPSLYGESFGIVLIEAMASGSGVVMGGNNPGYASILADHPQLLFEPEDTAGFAKKLLHILDNKAEAEKIHAWQQKEVEHYDVDRVGHELLKIYHRAIANAKERRHN